MKLSPRTIEIFNHFTSIHPNLLLQKGNVQATKSVNDRFLVRATLEESIPMDLLLPKARRFLKALQTVGGHLRFTGECLVIGEDNHNLKYRFERPGEAKPPRLKKQEPEFQYEFDLSRNVLERAVKAVKVLGLPCIGFKGDGKYVSVMLTDGIHNEGDCYQEIVPLGEVKFNMVIKQENWQVLSDNYVVRLSKEALVKLASSDLTYYMACDGLVWE